MRILIDILHPAHVHFFKHFRTEMLDRGHEVLVTAREKDVAVDLLEELGIPHEVISTQRSGLFGLAGELAQRSYRLARIARRFRPTVLTGIMGVAIAPVGRMLRIPSVVFYDSEFADRTNRIVYPLASAVCTPDAYQGRVRGNHLTYPGYHELAYLHPNRFTARPESLAQFGLSPPFALVRFVSWEASHDLGRSVLGMTAKRDLITRLLERVPVVVSSESALPHDLERLRLRGPAGEIHQVLAQAAVVVGDSGTMVSEAAVLGTPAVLISPMRAGVHDDQIDYGLLARFEPEALHDAWGAISGFLDSGPPPGALTRMLVDKTDVTEWMATFFERPIADAGS